LLPKLFQGKSRRQKQAAKAAWLAEGVLLNQAGWDVWSSAFMLCSMQAWLKLHMLHWWLSNWHQDDADTAGVNMLDVLAEANMHMTLNYNSSPWPKRHSWGQLQPAFAAKAQRHSWQQWIPLKVISAEATVPCCATAKRMYNIT